ncbi:MAG: M28 family peptidase [Bacteroidales bacterium]
MKRILPFALALLFTASAHAQFSTPASRLEGHVNFLASDSLLGRGFGSPEGDLAARYIAGQFEEAGILPLDDSYFHPFNFRQGILNISGKNVVGIIRGSDPVLRNEFIVLGAHYDHLGWKLEEDEVVVYNGADDNASGVASLIEIGRNLASGADALGRSVVFVAFDGEESGLIGSKQFLTDRVVEPDRIKLMVSLDMVGMYEKHKGIDLEGVELITGADALQAKLASEYGLSVTKSNESIEQRTDTAPFGKMGIPAVHAFTGSESPYHKPEDDAGLLDYDGMAVVTNALSALTEDLSMAGEISDMRRPSEEDALYDGPAVLRAGFMTGLGSSYHDYVNDYFQGKSIFSASGGLYAQLRLTKNFTLQPEVLYETKGSQHADGNFRTHSLTTPVSLLFTSPSMSGVRSYAQFGGYFSHHFGGRLGGTAIDFENTYANQEYGLVFGGGLEVMKVHMGVVVQRGISSLYQDETSAKLVHQNVRFVLGFIF